jgi:hypothetical protein
MAAKKWIAQRRSGSPNLNIFAQAFARRQLTFAFDYAPAVITPAIYRKDDVDPGMKRRLVARRKLRRASNKGTLRAFRNANRFTTFKNPAMRSRLNFCR